VAVRGDTIVAVGDSAEVARLAGPETRILANGRAMVTPGFMDGHLHFVDGGFQLASVDLRPANSPPEFIARLKAFALERKRGEWITGGDWDHERWEGAPLPRREWIDSVSPNNPVFVNRLDGHMALANTAALRLAGVTRATKDIPGGVIVRDPRTGEPTGILKDEAMGPVAAVIPVPSDEQRDRALHRAMEYAASKGVTAIAHVSVPAADLGAYLRAKQAGPSRCGPRSISRSRPGSRWPTQSPAWGGETTGSGSVGSKGMSTDPSARPRPCSTSPTPTTRRPRAC